MLKEIKYKTKIKLEELILNLSNKFNISLLKLAYKQMGILKYEDMNISGESFVIKKVLPELINSDDMVVFDVGANVGDYSSLINTVFPKAKIFAFEPNPYTFKDLENNFLKITTINCINCGLGNKKGELSFYTDDNNLTSSLASYSQNLFLEAHKNHNEKKITTNINTLDNFCEESHIKTIDFLKIDTEGYELEVLKGAIKMINNQYIKIIQFEFNQMNTINRVFLKDFYNILSKDYDFYRLNTEKIDYLGDYDSSQEIFKYSNYLAINKNINKIQVGFS